MELYRPNRLDSFAIRKLWNNTFQKPLNQSLIDPVVQNIRLISNRTIAIRAIEKARKG